jgi:membrane protein DedA with SNARE-associated domain
MTHMKAMRFLWLNFVSALSWSIIFALAGFLFGKSASLIVEDVESYEPYIMLVLASIIAGIWIFHFFHARWLRRHGRKRLKRMKEKRVERKETS